MKRLFVILAGAALAATLLAAVATAQPDPANCWVDFSTPGAIMVLPNGWGRTLGDEGLLLRVSVRDAFDNPI